MVSAGTTDATPAGHIYEAALISYLGRVNYNYADKYLLTLTARIDGSSRFAKGYKCDLPFCQYGMANQQ